MIFVTVGTHERPFTRLFREVERLIDEGKIKDKVVCQTGFTDYYVKSAKCQNYYSEKKMEKNLRTCKIMITHGGLGSIIKGIDYGKPVIAVPRLSKFGEHTDDHQLQIVKEMEKGGKIIAVYNISDLHRAIKRARSFKFSTRKNSKSPISSIVESTLLKWSTS